jgi:parvulin-like peptidyl-prolyl isomerase
LARLIAFLGIVALGVAGALFLISERAAITDAGYRVARLENERRALVEANRKLEAKIAAAKTPSALIDRVKGLQIDLVSPDQSLDQQVASAKEKEKGKTADASPRPKRPH